MIMQPVSMKSIDVEPSTLHLWTLPWSTMRFAPLLCDKTKPGRDQTTHPGPEVTLPSQIKTQQSYGLAFSR